MSVPEVMAEDRSGLEVDTDKAAGLAVALLVRLGFCGGELGVTFVTAGEMEQLNHAFMGREESTDVLSFPLDAEAMELETGFGEEMEAEEQEMLAGLLLGGASEEVPLLLGDVVICPEVAAARAPQNGNSLDEELCLLLIHGILHVSGYDHEIDEGEMEALQEKLFREMCRS